MDLIFQIYYRFSIKWNGHSDGNLVHVLHSMSPKSTAPWCEGVQVKSPKEAVMSTAVLSLQYWKGSIFSIQLKMNTQGICNPNVPVTHFKSQNQTHLPFKIDQSLILKSIFKVYICHAKVYIFILTSEMRKKSIYLQAKKI
jgi:hypothetical protein